MGHQKRKKDTTAPITKKEKERSRKSIPAIKSSRRSTKRKRKASTKQQHERQRKIKRKSKGKDACYKCGQQGHIIAELQCTTLATMSINSGRILQRMTGIKTRINTKIKDGTTRIGYIEDMIKNQGYQQPATLSSHHQQHRQEWHNPQCNGRHPHSNSHQQQMIDSAAATHLCPPWFGTSLLPLHAHHFVGSVACVCAHVLLACCGLCSLATYILSRLHISLRDLPVACAPQTLQPKNFGRVREAASSDDWKVSFTLTCKSVACCKH